MVIRGTLLPLAATPPYEPNAITKGVIENNVNTKEFFAYLCISLQVLAGPGRSCSQESHSTKTQISPRGGGSLLIKRSEAGGIQRGKDPVYLFVCLFVCFLSFSTGFPVMTSSPPVPPIWICLLLVAAVLSVLFPPGMAHTVFTKDPLASVATIGLWL